MLQVPCPRNLLLCVPRLFRWTTVCAAEDGPNTAHSVLRSSPHQETGTKPNMTNDIVHCYSWRGISPISQYFAQYIWRWSLQHFLSLEVDACEVKFRLYWLQVTSGGLAVYLSRGQEVWLETKDYIGMRGRPTGHSIFSGFLLRAHWPTRQETQSTVTLVLANVQIFTRPLLTLTIGSFSSNTL